MAWNEQLPEWNATGVEPPASKKNEGWKPDDRPPADWFNWLFNRAYKVMQEIRIMLGGHVDAAAPHSGHETPAGATAKASAAETNAKSYTDNHAESKATHGIGSGYYIAKTSRSDQLPAYADVQDKPSSFPPSTHTHPKSEISDFPTSMPPSSHKSTHASGGSDALSPADIGAATAAQGETADTAASDLAAHLAEAATDTDGVHGLKIEEGTWTPEIYAGSGTLGTLVYAIQTGKYYKVGKVVFCSFRIVLSALDPGANGELLSIRSLPYIGNNEEGMVFSRVLYMNLDVGNILTGNINGNIINLTQYGVNTGLKMLNFTNITEGTEIRGSITYKIA